MVTSAAAEWIWAGAVETSDEKKFHELTTPATLRPWCKNRPCIGDRNINRNIVHQLVYVFDLEERLNSVLMLWYERYRNEPTRLSTVSVWTTAAGDNNDDGENYVVRLVQFLNAVVTTVSESRAHQVLKALKALLR